MQEKFAVIGLGLLGTGIAKTLAEKGAEVLAIDNDLDKVEAIKEEVAHAVCLDSTDIKALKAQNVTDTDAVVIAIGHNFEGLLLTAVLLNELKVKRIVARVSNQHQRMILEKVGIEEMFAPDEEVGKTVADMLVNPELHSCLKLPDDYEIIEVDAPKKKIGKTLEELKLRKTYQLNLITIKRQFKEFKNGQSVKNYHIIGVPTSTTIIEENDVLILLGKTHDVNKFIQLNK
ncbi:MAG: TrkA family potassium uptake protein [Cytophagales bacterium]|nr:TrkA family potassium uptake protein [Cytophagales bacterium]